MEMGAVSGNGKKEGGRRESTGSRGVCKGSRDPSWGWLPNSGTNTEAWQVTDGATGMSLAGV